MSEVIEDVKQKISFISTHALKIGVRLANEKTQTDYGIRLKKLFPSTRTLREQEVTASVCAIFELGMSSWPKYISGTRKFKTHHLEHLTQFLLYLGGERSTHYEKVKDIFDGGLFYRALEICSGSYEKFEETLDLVIEGQSLKDVLFSLTLRAEGIHYRVDDIRYVHKLGWDGITFLDKLIEIDRLVLNGIRDDEEGTPQQWAPIFMSHPDTWRLIISDANEIIGYWHFVPLVQEMYAKATNGQLLDSEIHEDDIKIFGIHGQYDIYFVSLCIVPSHRTHQAVRIIFDSLFNHFLTLAEDGILVDGICAHAYTPYGASICKDLGMTEGKSHFRKGVIYTGRADTFVKSKLLLKHRRLLQLYTDSHDDER